MQLIAFASLWFAPLNVAWFIIALQLLHIVCYFACKTRKSWADAVTILRGTLTAGAAVWALNYDTLSAEIWALFLIAIVFDGLDGWIARKTQTTSPEGAIFDMETDGIWVSLMCITLVALGIELPWILILGAWRPVYVLVSSVLPRVETHQKGTFFGKAVFVTVAVVLMVVSSPWRSLFLTKALLILASILLSYSFLRSIALSLRQTRRPLIH